MQSRTLVIVLLLVAIWIVYGQVTGHQLVDFDDSIYLTGWTS